MSISQRACGVVDWVKAHIFISLSLSSLSQLSTTKYKKNEISFSQPACQVGPGGSEQAGGRTMGWAEKVRTKRLFRRRGLSFSSQPSCWASSSFLTFMPKLKCSLKVGWRERWEQSYFLGNASSHTSMPPKYLFNQISYLPKVQARPNSKKLDRMKCLKRVFLSQHLFLFSSHSAS